MVKFSALKNSPISSNHQNLHQNWWQKKHKIGWNYCHQKWWNFRHLKTHQFLQITKIFTKIGDNFGENSIENSNHQNFHQNWWKIWRKFNRKWMWSPTSLGGFRDRANCCIESWTNYFFHCKQAWKPGQRCNNKRKDLINVWVIW